MSAHDIDDLMARALSRGRLFAAHHSASKAAGASIDVQITTPSDQTVILVWDVWTEDLGTHVLYEAPTTDPDGTGLSEVNQNRIGDTPASADAAVVHSPTVSETGTAIRTQKHGIGHVPLRTVMYAKAGTKYMMRVTNDHGADAKILSAAVRWIE